MNIAVSQPTCMINNKVRHKLHMKLFPLWLSSINYGYNENIINSLAMHSNSLTTTAYTRTYT